MSNDSLLRMYSCLSHTGFIQHPLLTLGIDYFEKKTNENAALTSTKEIQSQFALDRWRLKSRRKA